jgi:adenylylsulfate kinase
MFMLFMTGLSGAGKSTLANSLQAKLTAMSINCRMIDSDVYRKAINKDLGFSAADRRENIYRLAKEANQLALRGIISIVAAINPFENQRIELTKKYDAKVIWIKCNLKELKERDTKGLYHKALLPDDDPDKLWNFTGINDPYEVPAHPDFTIDTTNASINESLEELLKYVSTLLKVYSS